MCTWFMKLFAWCANQWGGMREERSLFWFFCFISFFLNRTQFKEHSRTFSMLKGRFGIRLQKENCVWFECYPQVHDVEKLPNDFVKKEGEQSKSRIKKKTQLSLLHEQRQFYLQPIKTTHKIGGSHRCNE